MTGVTSFWVSAKTLGIQRKQIDVTRELGLDHMQAEHTGTILGGYSQIVEDLRGEVERLNLVIVELRKEQEECERRNDEMAKVVNELRQRVSFLEGVSDE